MKLLNSLRPKTLFGRSALLIAGVVVTGQLLTALSFYFVIAQPRMDLLADLAIDYVFNMRKAMDRMPTAERESFIKANESRRELRLERDLVREENQGQIPQPFVQLLSRLIQERMQSQGNLVLQVEPERALWLPFSTSDNEKYWVVIRLDRMKVQSVAGLLLPSLIITILSVLGALWIHRSINQPLLTLRSAVQAVGGLEKPRQLTPQGPTEVVELTLAFNRMIAELQQVEADRNLMLAGVSHDLRTPITRVRIALELMQKNSNDDLFKRVEANLKEVDAALTQFLDFARDERDEPVVEVDLAEVVRECAISYELDESRLKLDLPEATTLLRCRPQAIIRAVRNLIDNSLKYSTGQIVVQVRHSAMRPAIIVLDEGDMLNDQELARLRLPFMRQLDSRGGVAGTGLGLAIVDRIAAMHGAKLQLQSREHGGLKASIEF